MTQPGRLAFARLGAIAALTVALVATCVSAYAAPSIGPTLGTTELQQLIEESPTGYVDGYLSTVLKGSTITDMSVRITAVTYGFSDGPPELSALILFEVTDPRVIDPGGIGGIAAGMSGSPIYVDDGGTDKLVGALSYGNWFTKNGFGLATPIEAMTVIENYPAPMGTTSLKTLAEPVVIDGQAVNSIVITDNPDGFEKAAASGTFVAKPLTSQYVGGLDPRSKLYRAYKKHVEANGGSVVPLVSGLSSMESTYNAQFEPGSAIAVLAAKGDLWAGGVGTVTYVNGLNVLAFGHPMNYEGKSGLFMSNAWVDGVWPSLATPYKMARPAALRGTLTQDRGAGIMGVDGLMTAKASVTATVTYREDTDDNGSLDYSKVGTSTTEIPSFAINNAGWSYEGLAPVATYLAASHATDAYGVKGSALTTTTVVVKDGATEFTLVRANMFDDSYDIAGAAMMDVATIVYELQQLGANGIAHPKIQSVSLAAEIAPVRRTAEVVAVDVSGGLRTGDNTATVSLLQWGVEATQTVEVPFTIPAGVPLTGELQASNAWGFDGGEEMFDEEEYYFYFSEMVSSDRRTTAQAVKDIDAELPNNTLKVTFQPVEMASMLDSGGEDEPAAPTKPKTYKAIETTQALDYVVTGGAAKTAPVLNVKAYDMNDDLVDSPTLPYGSPAMVEGELLGAQGDVDIAVSRLYYGSSTPSRLTTITFDPEDEPFGYFAPGMTRTGTLTFRFAGDENTLATQGSVLIRVRASTSLSASSYRFKRGRTTTLRASVAPLSATGKIVFERYSGGWWYSIGTRTLVGGKASLSYKPSRTGTYKVRARYVPAAGSTNAASSSSSRTLRVVR